MCHVFYLAVLMYANIAQIMHVLYLELTIPLSGYAALHRRICKQNIINTQIPLRKNEAGILLTSTRRKVKKKESVSSKCLESFKKQVKLIAVQILLA